MKIKQLQNHLGGAGRRKQNLRLGECSAEYTDNVLGSKVESGSTFSTDGSKAQLKYAKLHGLECVQIKGGRPKKDIYHIQHINNFHSVLKKFIYSRESRSH